MSATVIVDYGMCNLDSVKRAVESLGGKAVVSNNSADLRRAGRIIIPGVGAFPRAMSNLHALGLVEEIKEQALAQQIPLLGICLGMQLLASHGTEVEPTEGLGLLAASVQRLEPTTNAERIPHVGWNEVAYPRESPLFKDIPEQKDFYFVHSYAMVPESGSVTIGITPFSGQFVSAVQVDNIFGVQFHPEKSQKVGRQLLNNFIKL